MFCLGCGGLLPSAPAGEPGGGWPGAKPSQGPRCGRCGSGRSIPGAVGPSMGVRVQTAAGGHADLPISTASVCIDCGSVTLALPEDARRYLAGVAGA
ncbi:MAG TPA: hypothetical protein VGL81_23940 [Polyangiaceae bacterium]